MPTKLLFISTAQDVGLATELIESIKAHNKVLPVHLVMTNQIGDLEAEGNAFLTLSILNTHKTFNSSEGRNYGIEYAIKNKIEADFVFFPDDDTTFDNTFFERFDTYITDPKQNYMIRVLNNDDHKEYKKFYLKNGEMVKMEHTNMAITHNLILPYALFTQVRFDEKLGVGARFGSSEDLDYFLQCQIISPFKFVKALHCFHPSRDGKYKTMKMAKIRSRFYRYSHGYLYVMFKYNFWGKAYILPLRTLGGVALSLLRFNFPMAWAYFALFFQRLWMIGKFSFYRLTQPNYFK